MAVTHQASIRAICAIGIVLTLFGTHSSIVAAAPAPIASDYYYVGMPGDIKSFCPEYVRGSVASELPGWIVIDPNAAIDGGYRAPDESGVVGFACQYSARSVTDVFFDVLSIFAPAAGSYSVVMNGQYEQRHAPAGQDGYQAKGATILTNVSLHSLCAWTYGEQAIGYTGNVVTFNGASCIARRADGVHSRAGTIVRQASSGASWLVAANGTRQHIDSSDDYNCFTERGIPVHNVENNVLDTLPDQWGSHAQCDRPTYSVRNLIGDTVHPLPYLAPYEGSALENPLPASDLPLIDLMSPIEVSSGDLRNGSFESSNSGWNRRAGSGVTHWVRYDNASKAHDGRRYLAFNTNQNGSIYQDLSRATRAGDTIAVQAAVRSQGTSATGRLCVWALHRTRNENNCTRYSVGPDWELVSVVMNPTTAHDAVRIEFYPDKNAGTTFIDSVTANIL